MRHECLEPQCFAQIASHRPHTALHASLEGRSAFSYRLVHRGSEDRGWLRVARLQNPSGHRYLNALPSTRLFGAVRWEGAQFTRFPKACN